MIELKNVCKRYGETTALDGISFSIKKGEIVGFVGPNGAGKSTAMKIITTYTAPTSGSASVGGFNGLENPIDVRRMIGYLPETVPLYSDMLVSEYLEFIGTARHLDGNLKKRTDWVVEACGLGNVLKRKIGVLSKGFKQRTCLAQALIHDPEVLILDEPTSGLDPLQIIGIRNLIKNLSHSKTIVLSTHILSEASIVSDRILMINNGKLVADGTFDDLVSQVSNRRSMYLSVKAPKKDLEAALKGIRGVDEIRFDENVSRGSSAAHIFSSPKTDLLEAVNEVLRRQKWTVLEFQQEKLSLEDTFIRLTQGSGKAGKEENA